MSRLRARTASFGNRSDLQDSTPALGIVPLRPSPAPATIVQNLAASLIGNIQEDIRCACHIDKSLYTGDNQGTILRWNPLDASKTTFYDGLGAPVNVVVGVNDKKAIWAGLANGNITVVNVETQSLKTQMIHAHDAAVNCIAVGIQCAWSGGDDFLIKKWDMEGVELFAYNHHHGFIKDLLVLRNETSTHVRLWGASSDASISVAALQDNRTQHTLLSDIKMLRDHSKGVSALCVVGADAIWSGCEDGSIGVWSSLGVLRKQVQQAHKGPVGSFVVMGAHVWSGSGDHTVLVWESSSCQLLFSLGDHGGFVKSMVRVDYMCWIFASGKNVRIWCAQSVWDTYEGEKDRLNRGFQRLKESLEKAQRDKQSLESVGKKFQQDLQAAQQQLNQQRGTEASALETMSAEIEKLKSEHAKALEDLETNRENARKDVGSLHEEVKILLEKLSKLKAEKEAGEKGGKIKVQRLEKNLEELGGKHKKALEGLAALKTGLENTRTELQSAQGDLASARRKGEDLLAAQNLDYEKNVELEKSLKTAHDRNQKLQFDLAQSLKDKKNAEKVGTSAQAEYEKERAELEGKIKQLQEDLNKAHESTNASLTAKDAEMQKLQSELKKKIKELRKKFKQAEEDKKRSGKELEELKEIIDQLKKSQEASSSAEAESNEKLASELNTARDDLQRALSDKFESLDVLQAENEKLKGLIKESEKNAGASKEAYEQAYGALEDDLKKTKAVLADATKEKDEAGTDAAFLRERLQELKQNVTQLKDLAAARDGSSEELTKERDELLGKLNDAASETQGLRDDISQLSLSASTQASTLEELRSSGEKRLNDLQESEQKRKDLEEVLEDAQKKYSEELAKLSDTLDSLRTERARLEEWSAQASAEMEKLRVEKTSQEDGTVQISQELDQLKKEKAELEEKLAQKAAEVEWVSQELNQIKKGKPAVEQELDQIMKEKATIEEKLAQKTDELAQALMPRFSEQDTVKKVSQEIEELKAQNLLLESKLSASVSEVEELNKARRLQEKLAASKAAEFDQMVREMETLGFMIEQKKDEYRLAKEGAIFAAAEAARRIEELQDKIASLELKLEDELAKAQAAMSVDESVQARIRELENAVMQAHMDYRLLNQEVRHMRKKRGRNRENPVAIAGIRPPCQADGLDVTLKMMQPGLCIDYTKLKVSRSGHQRGTVKNIEEEVQQRKQHVRFDQYAEGNFLCYGSHHSCGRGLSRMQTTTCTCWRFEAEVSDVKLSGHLNQVRIRKHRGSLTTMFTVQVYAQTSNPGTLQRIIPIRQPLSHPGTPQRVVPIQAPSPSPEMIEPVVNPRPQSTEKERYFPSHGPMRVRRGLSAGRQQ